MRCESQLEIQSVNSIRLNSFQFVELFIVDGRSVFRLCGRIQPKTSPAEGSVEANGRFCFALNFSTLSLVCSMYGEVYASATGEFQIARLLHFFPLSRKSQVWRCARAAPTLTRRFVEVFLASFRCCRQHALNPLLPVLFAWEWVLVQTLVVYAHHAATFWLVLSGSYVPQPF